MRSSTALSLILSAVALALAPGADASGYTVGPGGTHATLHEALAAASSSAGDHEIRIAAGTFVGNSSVFVSLPQEVLVSGGWDAAFAMRADDPGATVLEGASGNMVLAVNGQAGRIEIANLTMTHPHGTLQSGACAVLTGGGSLVIVLRDSVATGCVTKTEWHCSGAGVNGYARDTSRVELLRNGIVGNRCESLPPTASPDGPGRGGSGGGMYAGAQDQASVLVAGNHIEGNELSVDGGQGNGAGLSVFVVDDAQAEVSGNRIVGNLLAGTVLGGYPAYSLGSALAMTAGSFPASLGASSIQARSNVVSDNLVETDGPGGAQVLARTGPGGTLTLADSEVSAGQGNDRGVFALAEAADSLTRLTNLTIAGHAGPGVRMQSFDGGMLSLHNSILAGNTGPPDLAAGATTGSNLIADAPDGPDPRFVDAAGGDYRLRTDSPARDAGSAAVPGGLGTHDAQGGTRVVGIAVDIGAYEFGAFAIFASGFEP